MSAALNRGIHRKKFLSRSQLKLRCCRNSFKPNILPPPLVPLPLLNQTDVSHDICARLVCAHAFLQYEAYDLVTPLLLHG